MLIKVLFFWQALEEPSFSIAYANLCKVLSPIKVECPHDGKTKVTTFRRVLLTKCQQEFEKDKKEDEEKERMLVAIEQAETVSGSHLHSPTHSLTHSLTHS